MKTLKIIDNILMKIFTYNFSYRKYEDRPQLTLAILSTSFVLFFFLYLRSSKVDFACFIFFLLSSLYEWRLWYRLRKEGIIHPVTEGLSFYSPLMYIIYRTKELLKK
jgi:hypothetical protein